MHGVSLGYYKKEVKEYLESKFDKDAKVLDVGAGSGTYFNLLHDYFEHIDAVEVFKPNIEDNHLADRYENVYNEDIRNFKYDFYDIDRKSVV